MNNEIQNGLFRIIDDALFTLRKLGKITNDDREEIMNLLQKKMKWGLEEYDDGLGGIRREEWKEALKKANGNIKEAGRIWAGLKKDKD